MTTALLVLSTSLFVTFREISFLPAIHLFTYSLVQQTFAQCPLRSDQCSQRRGQSGWHDSQRLWPGEGVARRTGRRGLRPRSACGEQARPGLRGAVYRAACGRPSGPWTPVQRPAGTEGASQTSVFQAPARYGQWTRWRPDSDLAWERGHRGGGPEEASVAGAERAGVGELRKAAVAVALVWRPTMNVRT